MAAKLQINTENIKNILFIISGKGGVGKSTIATILSKVLTEKGKCVGVLDLDLCGPSQAKLFGVSNKKILQSPQGWIPVTIDDSSCLSVISLANFLENEDDAIIWRGPKKTSMIQQMITNVAWGKLDFLVIDMPPGTSDEHISIFDALAHVTMKSAILITTPQLVSLNDVRRIVTFCRKVSCCITGIVENMSGFTCPHCNCLSRIFSTSGGKLLAEEMSVPYLGEIPIDPNLQKYLTTPNFHSVSTPIVEYIRKLADTLI